LENYLLVYMPLLSHRFTDISQKNVIAEGARAQGDFPY
jgi:hypothetical protein